jgi:DNA polymerase III subunit gamma/tau
MSVYHLKYRPHKISELDLADVADKISKILLSESLPHSFLFSGPKGSGKTSAARILAQNVNCLERIDGEACGKCKNCLSIEDKKAIDIIEIDAASNRGIDDVRSIKENAYLSPVGLKYKVFIIDEVHMLTKEAFNALLKIIEEPPAHVLFVLCTTDENKIPETVLSRLVKISFRKGKKDELKKSIKRIIDGEGFKMEDDFLDILVENSDGSFRNVHKIFNEIVMQYGGEFKTDLLMSFFANKGGDYTGEEIEKDLISKDKSKIVKKLEDMAQRGVDFEILRQNWIAFFQKRLLSNLGIGEKLVGGLGNEVLSKWLNLLIVSGKLQKEVDIDQLPLQLAVIDFIGDARVEKKDKELETEKPKVNVVKPTIKKVTKEIQSVEETINKSCGCDLTQIEESWGKLLSCVKPHNHSVEAFLRATRPKIFDGRKLVVEVFYPFHKDKLEELKNKQIVERGIKDVFGISAVFECVLSKSKKKPLVVNNETPINEVSSKLGEERKSDNDLYSVVKDIFS